VAEGADIGSADTEDATAATVVDAAGFWLVAGVAVWIFSADFVVIAAGEVAAGISVSATLAGGETARFGLVV
jgi:hypothetical protein